MFKIFRKEKIWQENEYFDEIWKENFQTPILFTWIDWLKNNTINFLDIIENPNKIILTCLRILFN